LAIQLCTQYTTVGRWFYRILCKVHFSQSVGCDRISVIGYTITTSLSTYRRLSYIISTNKFIFAGNYLELVIGHWALELFLPLLPLAPSPFYRRSTQILCY
jgi:hypothetical protein